MKKSIGIYSILLGFAILCVWAIRLLQGNFEDGIISLSFHLYSEFITAVVLLVSGFMMQGKKPLSIETNIAGHAMVIYSVLNSAGNYFQSGNWKTGLIFIILFIISVAAITANSYIQKRKTE